MKKRAATFCMILALAVSMVILPGTRMLNVRAAAQNLEPPRVGQLRIPAATLRTIDNMLVDQATGVLPEAPEEIPFRTGMDPAQYAAAKAAAAAAPKLPKPVVPQAPGLAPVVLVDPDGEDQTCATDINGGQHFPPDADGAVGTSQFVQTTNDHITIWDKTANAGGCSGTPGPLLDIDHNSFFGYLPPTFPNAKLMTDARVVHDDTYGRWVIVAIGHDPEGGAGSPHRLFIAVSLSEDATGPYFIFQFDTTNLTCSTCFWDFPQIGMDDGSVILTGNIFNPGFVFSRWVFLNKADLYNGTQLTICSFSGGVVDQISWAPPKVLDQNNGTWMAEAPQGGNTLILVQLTATSQVCPLVVSINTVSVPTYSIPMNAPQPGTNQVLHTSDARFQNRSWQVGDQALGQTTRLFQTHTTNDFGTPTPRLYTIRLSGPGAPVVDLVLDYFASNTSYDFNPSIAVNSANTAVVTWSSTDPSFGVNAQVRVGAIALGGAFGQALVFQSSVPLVGNFSPQLGAQRWGDYSATMIDPTNGGIAWGVNEEVDNPHDPTGLTWGTRFFAVGIP